MIPGYIKRDRILKNQKSSNKRTQNQPSFASNISGWNTEDPFQYVSETILNYLTPTNTTATNSLHSKNKKKDPFRSLQFTDENKYNLPLWRKNKLQIKLDQKAFEVPKTSRRKLIPIHYESQNIQTQIAKSNIKERRAFESRQNTLTHRKSSRKEYPKNIYQFMQSRKQLDQINYPGSFSSEKSFSLLLGDSQGIQVLPKIRPFLNPTKLLKLQNLRKMSPLDDKSPRLFKTNKKRNNCEQLLFSDQKIFCSSIQYSEH